ncbi:MAG: hypothetical protein MZV65_42055 [Chromatiales bacterium]|nr:hypothetical protein [Chromatiales bacterium]
MAEEARPSPCTDGEEPRDHPRHAHRAVRKGTGHYQLEQGYRLAEGRVHDRPRRATVAR